MASSEADQTPVVLSYARLVRLPNLFTAAADPLMGALFVRPVEEPVDVALLACVAGAACLLYAGGVVLNDVFDVNRDAEERPERPIPAGRIPRDTAKWLGVGLLVIGVLVGFAASVLVGHLGPGVVALMLAGCVVLYDGYAKQTAVGPPVMGLCRSLNVLLGMSLMSTPWQSEHWLIAAAIGVFITGVTCFARGEAEVSRRGTLIGGLLLVLAGFGLLALLPLTETPLVGQLALQPQRWFLLMAALGALTGWRFFRAIIEPGPARVQQAVAHGILSVVLLDAAVVAASRGMAPAVMVLALVLPAMLLGRVIRMT